MPGEARDVDDDGLASLVSLVRVSLVVSLVVVVEHHRTCGVDADELGGRRDLRDDDPEDAVDAGRGDVGGVDEAAVRGQAEIRADVRVLLGADGQHAALGLGGDCEIFVADPGAEHGDEEALVGLGDLGIEADDRVGVHGVIGEDELDEGVVHAGGQTERVRGAESPPWVEGMRERRGEDGVEGVEGGEKRHVRDVAVVGGGCGGRWRSGVDLDATRVSAWVVRCCVRLEVARADGLGCFYTFLKPFLRKFGFRGLLRDN